MTKLNAFNDDLNNGQIFKRTPGFSDSRRSRRHRDIPERPPGDNDASFDKHPISYAERDQWLHDFADLYADSGDIALPPTRGGRRASDQ